MEVEVTVLPAGAGRENQTCRTYVASCRDGAPTAAGFPTTTSQIAEQTVHTPPNAKIVRQARKLSILYIALPAFTE